MDNLKKVTIVMVIVIFLPILVFGQSDQVILLMDEGQDSTTVNLGTSGLSYTVLRSTAETGDGVSTGPVWSTDTPFSYENNHSLYFRGEKDNIDLGAGQSNNILPQNVTVEAWIKPEENTTADHAYIMLGKNDIGQIRFVFRLSNEGGQWQLVGYLYNEDDAPNRLESELGAIVLDQWQHVAMTYDTTSGGKLYLNGTAVDSIASFGAMHTLDGYWTISHPTTLAFKGWIDEVRLSDFARVPGTGSGLADTLAWNASLHSLVPPAPEIVSPADSAVNVSITPTLTWSSVPEATSYQVQVASDPVFNTIVTERTGVLDTSAVMGGLSIKSTYYWRVAAIDDSGDVNWSGRGVFTTEDLDLPESSVELWMDEGSDSTTVNLGTAGIPYPTLREQAEIGHGDTLGPIWATDTPFPYEGNHSLYFDGYKDNIDFVGSAEGAFEFTPTNLTVEAWIKPEDKTSAAHSYVALGRNEIGQIRFAFRISSNEEGWQLLGYIWNEDGDVVILRSAVDAITLNEWQHVAVTYDTTAGANLYLNGASVASADTFGPLLSLGGFWTVSHPTTLAFQGWMDEVRISNFARVPGDGSGAGNSLAWNRSLHELAPDAPELVTPADSAIDVSIAPELKWTSTSGAASYKVQVSSNEQFTRLATEVTVGSDTTVQVSGLAVNSPYYWRVGARNADGKWNYSAVGVFTTEDLKFSPSLIDLRLDRGSDSAAVNYGEEGTFFSILRSEELCGDGDTLGPTWSNDTPFNYDGNHSLYFEGENDNVDLTDGENESFTPANLTVEAWIKPEDKTSSAHSYVALGRNEIGQIRFAFRISSNEEGWQLLGYIWNEDGDVVILRSAVDAIRLNEWQHVAVTYDTTAGANLYLDGTSVASAEAFGSLLSLGGGWTVSHPTTLAFQGWIDEFRISSFARVPGNGSGAGNTLAWNGPLIGNAPAIPELVSPADSSIDASVTPTLEWNAVEGAVAYGVLVSPSQVFRNLTYESIGITSNSITTDSVEADSTYYWRVGVINADSVINWSDRWMFTTEKLVGLANDTRLPKVFRMYQNYPNPFNPTTTIRYDVPRKSQVTISVYNILGKKVTELVYKQHEAGRYKVEFNAVNYSSGVYFYRIKANSYSDIKKFIILK